MCKLSAFYFGSALPRVLTVAAVLMISPVVMAQDCPVAPAKGGHCWTTEDVLSSQIDHHAQSALFNMFARGGNTATEASAILCALKSGKLAGVYLPDQGIPAQRARKAGSNWWEMIPAGAHATCYAKPAGQPPLIAFRKQIKDNRDFVARALSSAWKSCRIPSAAPRCYIPTISRPAKNQSEETGSPNVTITPVDHNGTPFPRPVVISISKSGGPGGAGSIGSGKTSFYLDEGYYLVSTQDINSTRVRSICPISSPASFTVQPGETVAIKAPVMTCKADPEGKDYIQ